MGTRRGNSPERVAPAGAPVPAPANPLAFPRGPRRRPAAPARRVPAGPSLSTRDNSALIPAKQRTELCFPRSWQPSRRPPEEGEKTKGGEKTDDPELHREDRKGQARDRALRHGAGDDEGRRLRRGAHREGPHREGRGD